ncbi:OLC1v1018069C1 [Oldenlandia corymbosa var. corymbosa]|uniref:peroxidase n=1 Tax=Oldenlandia corymbosa var. corymbosa TaxID=529605 RepID=A0AAV1EAR9_OLDCO|nr:OLC1v1018069C1 [Oldenlandia corymbosa var. corymbosa]
MASFKIKVICNLILIAFLYSNLSQAFPGKGFGRGGAGYSGLFPEFYQFSCPQANEIVMSVLEKAISRDPRMPASLLRLHFHDCFVRGCDASVLLDDSATIVSEKNSGPNKNSIRGFEVIDEIKAKLELECPRTVSCADILALAARDSVVLSGGPHWEVSLGRRDSRSASLSESNRDIPAPNSTVQTLISFFQRQGLNEEDLVALSGGHSIGVARCVTFRQRLYNQNGNNKPDMTLEKTYYNELKAVCPQSAVKKNHADECVYMQGRNRMWKRLAAATTRKRSLVILLFVLALFSAFAFFIKALHGSCDVHHYEYVHTGDNYPSPLTQIRIQDSPLSFMKSKLVLLVSHELSLSGGPLLLMELAFLLRGVGTQVVWITYQKPVESDEVVYSLEQKMLERGVKVVPAKGQEAVDVALKSDLVILNTAVAGKWLDAVLKGDVSRVLPKVLWWIHEMRGHYFKLEFVKHLPFVAGAMIDSHTTAEYWKNRTQERLKIKMPDTYVVHLGNSNDLMDVAEDSVARRVLREHIRESLGLRKEDLAFAIINSVSRGKGQDLFLRAFYESLQIIQERKLQVPSIHALVVGSDMNAQTKFETELRTFVVEKKIQDRVHFVNKTLNVSPYLASIDVLVQNSQARGECFGRITIEAMAFKLPVLGTAAGGTTEIVVNGTTGWLHPAGKEGVTPLAENIVKLATDAGMRRRLGEKGYERVKETFLEHHMSSRISLVLKEVLQKAKNSV